MAGSGYVGKAGQLAVMAEFLLRGYNVAMPEVDVGDDIFVVHDREGKLWRIQVKTAVGIRRGYGYSGRFAVSEQQLRRAKDPDLFLVFALRAGDRWEFLVLPRQLLSDAHDESRIAATAGLDLLFNLRLSGAQAMLGGRDFQPFRNHWEEWPPLNGS